MALVDRLEAHLAESRAAAERLMEAVVGFRPLALELRR